MEVLRTRWAVPLILAGGLLCQLSAPAGATLPDRACAECHGRPEQQALREGRPRSLHVDIQLSTAVHAGVSCAQCHADVVSLPHPQHLRPVDCRPCHQEAALSYAQSMHGQKQAAGDPEVPGCASCHGSHDIPAVALPAAAHRQHILSRCAGCHADIAAIYQESVHGKAVSQGIQEAPVCTDCHREHGIAPLSAPGSSIAARNLAQTCGSCHDEERIADKYGLPTRRYATYLDSYHGVVSRYGGAAVINCASCHGVHDIRPSSDPASSIHPANLGKTCGACHPGVEKSLTGVKVHVEARPESSRGMYYVRLFYTYFIGILMVCFVLYISVEVYGSLHRRSR